MSKKPVEVWIEFMMDLTGGLSALAQLKLNASVELSGDQTVGYNHHHSRDEEQSEQQQHIPEKQPEWKERNNTQRGKKELNQLPKPTEHNRFSLADGWKLCL